MFSKPFWELSDNGRGRPVWIGELLRSLELLTWRSGPISFPRFALMISYASRLLADLEECSAEECQDLSNLAKTKVKVLSDDAASKLSCASALAQYVAAITTLVDQEWKGYLATGTLPAEPDLEESKYAMTLAPDLMKYLDLSGTEARYKYSLLSSLAKFIGASVCYFAVVTTVESATKIDGEDARWLVVQVAGEFATMSWVPSMFALLTHDVRQKIIHIADICKSHYKETLSERWPQLGKSTGGFKLIDPECAVGVTLLEMALAFAADMESESKATKFSNAVPKYERLLALNRFSNSAVRSGDYSDVKDFICASADGSWPDSVPESEQLLVQHLSTVLLWPPQQDTEKDVWRFLYPSVQGSPVVVIRAPSFAASPLDADIPPAMVAALANHKPAWAWALRLSGNRIGDTFVGYFNGSVYRQALVNMVAANQDELIRRQIFEVGKIVAEIVVDSAFEVHCGPLIHEIFPALNKLDLVVTSVGLKKGLEYLMKKEFELRDFGSDCLLHASNTALHQPT
jgi:hypothetical protein